MTVRSLLAFVAFGIFFCLPFVGIIPGWSISLATITLLAAISAIGLNLVFGLVGMLAFGQAVFSGLAGYVAIYLCNQGVPLLVALGCALALIAIVACLLGKIFVRLPGAYFAIGTMCAAFVAEGALRAFPATTGGASGLVLAREVGHSDAFWYSLAALLFLTCSVIYRHTIRGRLYRALVAIRHDELSSGVLGIDTTRLKVRAFTLGSLFSGVGGLALSQYAGVSIPEAAGVSRSLEQLAIVIIGGAGLPLGPILGATVTSWLLSVAGEAQRFEVLLYGGLFLATILFAPAGLGGLVRYWTSAWPRLDDDFISFRRFTAGTERPSIIAATAPGHTASQTCLSVEGLSKRFGGLVAVSHVSLNVSYGSIVGLIGPNGAGKSTLFNVISGVEAASAGRIRINGRDISNTPVHERAQLIGRSFQVPRITGNLNVLDNMLVRLDQIHQGGEEERRRIATSHLERFGLGALTGRPTRNLGLGTMKILEVARAAIGHPSLILLDEPAVGLTEDEIGEVARMLMSLRSAGCAILIVEHNIEFLSRIADFIFVLDRGELIASGTAAAVTSDARVRQAYLGSL